MSLQGYFTAISTIAFGAIPFLAWLLFPQAPWLAATAGAIVTIFIWFLFFFLNILHGAIYDLKHSLSARAEETIKYLKKLHTEVKETNRLLASIANQNEDDPHSL